MLTEGFPESDWTPWQREQMRGWDRLWTRDKQQLRVGQWISRQDHTHDCVCLADIADWCAREPSDIKRDPERLIQAYSDLQRSILQGEFSEGGRLKVIHLTSFPSLSQKVKLRLDAEQFRKWLRPDRILTQVIESSWVPRHLAVRWLKARKIDAPPWLVDQTPRAKPAHSRASSTPIAYDPGPLPSRAKRDDVHNAITAVYAGTVGKPPNLKQIIAPVKAELLTTNQTATGKEITYCAKDKRHSGKRRPRGRTLKSERTQRENS